MNEITIVIPCYNESESLPELINQLEKLQSHFNFILIDNGSTDKTQEYLNSIDLPTNISFLKKGFNTGYGAGIKFGLKEVKTKYTGWMHADLQQNAKVLSHAKELIEIIDQEKFGKSIALKGLRSSRSILDNFFTIGVALFTSTLFYEFYWDIAGQPNIFQTSSLTFLDEAPDGHEFEFFVYIQFKKLKGTFIRFDAPFHKRRFGKSSWDQGLKSKLKHAKSIFKYILYLRFKSLF